LQGFLFQKNCGVDFEMSQQVKLVSRWGSLFPGETGTYPDDVAEMLVKDKVGKRVLENGELEPWADEVEAATESAEPEVGKLSVTGAEENVFAIDQAKDPFILDGLDVPTSTALHAGGLHTPGDVEKYLNDGKALTDLANIAEGRAKKILDLYGVK
jgi:hypothetical protein